MKAKMTFGLKAWWLTGHMTHANERVIHLRGLGMLPGDRAAFEKRALATWIVSRGEHAAMIGFMKDILMFVSLGSVHPRHVTSGNALRYACGYEAAEEERA